MQTQVEVEASRALQQVLKLSSWPESRTKRCIIVFRATAMSLDATHAAAITTNTTDTDTTDTDTTDTTDTTNATTVTLPPFTFTS